MSIDINISNYESYLYSYVDGELNAAETAALERFLESNPSLQAELDLLLATRLQPEEVVFDNKAALYRGNEIHLQNYESYLFSYIDDELNEAETNALEQFMLLHPKVRHELALLQRTKVQADPAIQFENKTVLYRHTKERRMRPAYWWAASAAALVAGALVFFQLNKAPEAVMQMADVAKTQQPAAQQPDAANNQADQQTVASNTPSEQEATSSGKPSTANRQTASAQTTGIAQNNTSAIKVTAPATQQIAPARQENKDLASLQTEKVTDGQQLETTLNTMPRAVTGTGEATVAAVRPSLDPQTPPSTLATAAPAAEPGELIMSVTGNGLESKVLDKVTNVARLFARKKKNN